MKKVIAISMILLTLFSTFTILSPQAKAEPDETPLEVAEKAALWIMDEAIPEAGGYKWKFYTHRGRLYYPSGVQCGAAGYGMFFLSLYEETENAVYLDCAEGAANWLITQAVPSSGGYKWPHGDDDLPNWWLSNHVSAIGEFLLKIYQTTEDSTYLEYATGAAQWMMAMTYWGEPGCFVPYNPPNPTGTQAAHGISPGREARTMTFLLHMYQETGNTAYLPYVEGMAEWLMSGPDKRAEGGGYKWRHDRPYGTHYGMEGHSRIALFFYETYQELGNAEYLEHANGAMTWLLSQALTDGDTAKWPHNPGSGYYPTLPFTGSYAGAEPNVCNLLSVAYAVTGDSIYLEYAKKHANWIISPAIAKPEGGGYKFPYGEGGSGYNAYQNARVYNFLSWMYDVTGETSYSEYANGALTWIVYDAETTDGGYKWRTLTYSPYYATWFNPGAAGIGYYLISALPILGNPPSAPENLDAYSGPSWISLIWSVPSDPGSSEIENYSIYCGTSSEGETFLASVDGSTLTYEDFTISVDTIYYYRVTAVNSFGESPPSNEVKCATEQSIKGLDSVVTLNEATTTALGRDIFSIQQNFHIHHMSDNTAIYWVQNIIYVCKIASVVSILGEMEVWDATTTPYTPIEYSPGLDLITSIGRPYPGLKTLPETVILSSTIDGNTLNMVNDCHKFDFSLPEATYIGGYPKPETVMVGWSSELSPITHLTSPTSGYMETYVRVGSDTWLEGDNEIVPYGEAQTAEKSTGLKWSFDGSFEYEEGALDQGFRFSPDYYGPIVSPPSASASATTGEALIISLSCSTNLSLFDSQNRHLGYNETTGKMDTQIPWAFHLVCSEDDIMVVYYPSDVYDLLVVGAGYGDYILQLAFMNESGIISGVSDFSGFVADGSVYVYSVDTTDEIVAIEPNPVAELRHLKEFIEGLPRDAFDKPRLTSQKKNALFNKIDEVILKVEAGNYTDAFNKLFHDIRAKMDSDSTAEDWIVDPETRSSLCIIIDHIISSIETLQQQ